MEQLREVIKRLLALCEEVGLYPNYQKLAYVQEYIYLGQLILFTDRAAKEVQRRLALGWIKLLSLRQIMKGKSIDLKRQVSDSCISSVVTFGCQAWSLTIAQQRKLQV
ncbi:uncharacterized protein [Halyomorpha halys]|uniref:uncharacterized protein n=1 Tax=Halyomorpha halys TaxID=286706 RepID=UPI0034D193F4